MESIYWCDAIKDKEYTPWAIKLSLELSNVFILLCPHWWGIFSLIAAWLVAKNKHMNHTAEVWWLQSLLFLFNHVTTSFASQNPAPFADIYPFVIPLPQEQGKHWKVRQNLRILSWWESTHEPERDFPFHRSVQKTQDEDFPTFKCPLLHTAATNSLWAASWVKYNNTFTLHTRIVISDEITPGDAEPRGCNEKAQTTERKKQISQLILDSKQVDILTGL